MADRGPLVTGTATGLGLQPEVAFAPVAAPWRVVGRRFLARRLTVVSLGTLGVLVVLAVVGGHLWHYRYSQITDDLSSPPSWAHPMGTDGLGHDTLAQVLRGMQKSMQVGLVVATLSTAVGGLLGATAGYYGGWLDASLMRLTDVVLSVPGIAVLAALAGSVRGQAGNWFAIALVISALSWTGIARVVRATLLSVREREFIEAARALGASDARILFRHLLPHAAGPLIVKATLSVGGAMLAEAGLSYLGLGISPPDTSLGRLVATGQQSAGLRPWLFYFPGLAIALIVVSVNFVGDGLRAALDPTARQGGRAAWPWRRARRA